MLYNLIVVRSVRYGAKEIKAWRLPETCNKSRLVKNCTHVHEARLVSGIIRSFPERFMLFIKFLDICALYFTTPKTSESYAILGERGKETSLYAVRGKRSEHPLLRRIGKRNP